MLPSRPRSELFASIWENDLGIFVYSKITRVHELPTISYKANRVLGLKRENKNKQTHLLPANRRPSLVFFALLNHLCKKNTSYVAGLKTGPQPIQADRHQVPTSNDQLGQLVRLAHSLVTILGEHKNFWHALFSLLIIRKFLVATAMAICVWCN